mgnify:FL=1
MMNIIDAYYSHILDIFMDVYGENIKCAQPGHCMKVTGFSIEVLRDLYGRLLLLGTNAKVFILSEDPNHDGQEYITPTKLIELRNDLTVSILVLIPVNSSTSAEDSYGNATFQELSITSFDNILFNGLFDAVSSNGAIKYVLNYADRALNASLQDKINYLLYVTQNGCTDDAIGNGLYLLGLLPDSSIVSMKDYIPQYLSKNDDCTATISDYTQAIADRISALPIKTNTIQKDVAKFLRDNTNIVLRKALCQKIFESYPGLNFKNWYAHLTNIIDLGVLHVTKVELSGKSLVIDGEDLILKMDSKKGAKVKLRIYFSPKPNAYEQLKKVKIAIMNGDGFYKETDVVSKKVSENTKDYRDITFTLDNQFNSGTYFFHVYAEDNDGTELNITDHFREEDIQKLWEEEQEKGLGTTKEDFQQSHRRLLTSDSDTFFLKIQDIDDTDDPAETGTRMKINNVLQAYFRYRIELNRKGLELTIPQRQAISDKSKTTSEDELKSWQFATHIKTFQLRYDSNNNYQIPLSIKLLELEEVILKNSRKLGYIDAIISDNYTDESLKSIILKEINDVAIPESLLEKRQLLFNNILDSAPDRTGVIETFEIFNHITEIKEYLEEYHAWLKHITDSEIPQAMAVRLQSIDTVSLQIEMPDDHIAHTKLLTPLHPIRLGWLVNIYEQYEDWEAKTAEDERYRKPDVWYKKLDKLFYGELIQEVAPLVMRDVWNEDYLQYVGELCFGWGFYANPQQSGDDSFSTGFRQLKAYVSQLLNIAVQYRIDSDVNKMMVYRLMHKYITQHPYTNKLIINLFNAGDAAVFADNLVMIEQQTANSPFNIHYEVRMFCNDKRFPQGEALRDLLNPDTQVSEEAENFSQDDNRLFPKLRFSVNSIDEFIDAPEKFPAHLSFLVNPFPTHASLKRSTTLQQSFYLNGVVTRPIVQVEKSEKGYMWHRYMSEVPLPNAVSPFANETQQLFSTLQRMIACSMTTDHDVSVPSLTLGIKDKNSIMLSLVHDVSDWVITFDKNMGPEFYDIPCKEGETPYLLDYLPSAELNGISSFLTCRPTSEIEGLMSPHFKNFGINVNDKTSFMELLADIRSVSSSMIMQLDSSRNKVFEVLGTTLMKRMLRKKDLLNDSFIIPIDLHQELFRDLDSASFERADDLLVDFHTDKREIVFTVIEIKCRQNLSDDELSVLQDKMQQQIENTILALRSHFDIDFKNPDRLDRELMTLELQSLLIFYARRAARYNYLNEETSKDYEKFILSLSQGDYTIRFKKLGLIYQFKSPEYQRKDIKNDTLFYIMGKPMIERILDKTLSIKTADVAMLNADEDFRTAFETSDRMQRENSFQLNHPGTTTTGEEQNDNVPVPALENTPHVDIDIPQPVPVAKPVEPIVEPVVDPSKQHQESSTPEEESAPQLPADSETEHTTQPESMLTAVDPNYQQPSYDIMVGKTSGSEQFGILGESINGHRKIAIDLSETNTISLFGVQGGGKSYTIGTITEMTLKQFSNVNLLPAPMASVIFHYSESMDYAPEFTSMIYSNDEAGQLKKLKDVYGAEPGNIEDVIMLCPVDKVEERKVEYPSIEIHPIAFHSTDLNVQDWMFLLKAVGNESTYINQLRAIMRANRKNLNIEDLKQSVDNSPLLSTSQKALAQQRLAFAEEYIDDTRKLGTLLKPGRLIIVDLRDEFIDKDDALGLFVIMLNIFSGVKQYEGRNFNKFIVFDEAHKYMDNKDLTGTIVTAIREMRHKGVSMMIASQDPMSLPTEIIELSSIMLMHKFNSPQWVKHVQKSITQLQTLSSADMASLVPGEAYLWATKSTDKGVTTRPMKISTRPRVTKHGGDTIKAI